MPVPTLLSINPDQLFVEYSISEIDDIQKKLQYEIERKREELRTMVGERYRDLIKAADTIDEMKTTSTTVIKHIENITNACKTTHENQLLGFRTETPVYDKINIINSEHSVVIQIKILTSLPEQIWSCIETEQYLVATQLYLFARHISTGLQLGLSKNQTGNIVAQWFPLAQRQWSAMTSFKDTIAKACEKCLQKAELDAKIASQCLGSLCLLHNIPIHDLLSTFISLRLEAVSSVLDSQDQHGKVKIRLMDSAKILSSTLELVYYCFVGDGRQDALISKELNLVAGPEALPSVQIADSANLSVNRVLPDVIAKYKPHIDLTAISPEQIKQAMSSWVYKVQLFAENQLTELINLVSTVRALHGIRQDAISIEKPENWNTICDKLYIPRNLEIYKTYYQPLITKRVQRLIEIQWTETLSLLQEEITDTLVKSNSDTSKNELQCFAWSEHIQEYENKHNSEIKNRSLLMKARGYSEDIIKLCEDFNKRLGDLLEDLDLYLYGEKKEFMFEHQTGNSLLFTDRDMVTTFLQQCCIHHVEKLIHFIKTECLHKNTCVSLARYLQAISQLCPNLQKCLSSSINSNDFWNKICVDLKNSSLECWQEWLKNFDAFVNSAIDSIMPSDFKLTIIITILPLWDLIKIDEKDDQDQVIESTIKVPSQPSLPLQQLLNNINEELNKISPHTLPRVIHQKLIEQTAHSLTSFYQKVAVNENVKANQNVALQFYVDVKYLHLLMIQRENKYLVEQAQMITDALKEIIDPFDFDVFYSHLQNNIKRSVQKTQYQLGSLVAKPEHLSSMLGTQTISTQVIPSVIALSNSQTTENGTPIPWFTLLPVTTPTNSSISRNVNSNLDKTKVKSTASFSPKHKPIDPKTRGDGKDSNITTTGSGLVRSGAAAFFGAMSQDWFGAN